MTERRADMGCDHLEVDTERRPRQPRDYQNENALYRRRLCRARGVAVQADIAKENDRAGDQIINWKIPVIDSLKHPQKNPDQDDFRAQRIQRDFFQRVQPVLEGKRRRFRVVFRRFHVFFPDRLLPGTALERPREQKRRDGQDKDVIQHMGVQVSNDKAVTWELVDRLVRHVGIVADKARGIRVSFCVGTFSRA